ncbi:hypothetical protein KY308_02780 [Candidatus Woesearchaeota archaeon]|nr:hypothetical protein [Candidatus Woesearchaeota archaeon]
MVKARVSLFSDRKYAHFYSLTSTIRHAFPARAPNENKYLGCIFYKNQNFTKRIDVYRINPEESLSDKLFQKNRELRKIPKGGFFKDNTYLGQKVDNEFSITYYLHGLDKRELDEIKRNARFDICAHLHKIFRSGNIIKSELKEIENLTTNSPVLLKRHVEIERGKGDFVPICKTGVHNIDFSGGCISYMRKDGTWDPTAGCEYCYSGFKNSVPLRIPVFNMEKIIEQIKQKNAKIIRFGKNSDPGHELFHEQQMQMLSVAESLGIHLVFVTKYLKFNEKIAKLLRKTNSTLQYSFGIEEIEHGPVHWGSTNDFRKRQALEYKKAGVNVFTRLVADITSPPNEFELEIMSLREKGIPTILTPVRVGSKDLAPIFTGETWDSLQRDGTQQLTLDGITEGAHVKRARYYRAEKGAGELLPLFMHEFYLKRFGKHNVSEFGGICGHIDDTVLCAGCGSFKAETMKEKDIPPMKYTKKPPKRKKNRDKATQKIRFLASQ